jgi:hypothetical protein
MSWQSTSNASSGPSVIGPITGPINLLQVGSFAGLPIVGLSMKQRSGGANTAFLQMFTWKAWKLWILTAVA